MAVFQAQARPLQGKLHIEDSDSRDVVWLLLNDVS